MLAPPASLPSLQPCPAPLLNAPLQGATFACVNAAVPGDQGKKEGGAGGEAAVAGGEAAAGGDADAKPAAAPHLATFALRIKAPDVLDQFIAAVNAHKAGGKKGGEEAAA